MADFPRPPTQTRPLIDVEGVLRFHAQWDQWFIKVSQFITATGAFGGVLPVSGGGTGISSYAVGDLLYASTTTTLARRAAVATGNALISAGVNTAPTWGKVGLTTHVSGVLPAANGGTGVANASTITIGGNVTLSGAFTFTGTVTGNTTVTFPTTGTLATTAQLPTSGTYTPTLTGVANVDASTAYQCQYSRVNNLVTVTGRVDVDPTLAATSTQLGISLPIASNLGAAEDCAGVAFASGIAGQGAAILGDTANDRAQMQWVAGDVTNQAMYFTFSYEVI